MDKSITTALMIVVSMVMALMLFNVAYPAVVQGGDAINSMASRTEERLKSQVAIIHAAGELDNTGTWKDTNGNGDFEVFVWVKNIGTARISPIESMDVFFGPEGNFTRIAHKDATGGSYPYWTGTMESAGAWNPTTTLRIAIHYGSGLSPDRYFMKVITPSGVFDEYFLGM
jgi:archaellum component FlaG (FlaF/FlaG flagellin family)